MESSDKRPRLDFKDTTDDVAEEFKTESNTTSKNGEPKIAIPYYSGSESSGEEVHDEEEPGNEAFSQCEIYESDSDDSDFGSSSVLDFTAIQLVEKIQDVDDDLLEELMLSRRSGSEARNLQMPVVQVELDLAEKVRQSVLNRPLGDSMAEIWNRLEGVNDKEESKLSKNQIKDLICQETNEMSEELPKKQREEQHPLKNNEEQERQLTKSSSVFSHITDKDGFMTTNVPYDQYLAALGYKIPRDIASRYSQTDMAKAVMYGILNTTKLRIPLPYLSNIDHLKAALTNANNILVITGAGISTNLGIPDFRSESGLYSRLNDLGLSDPQEVFDIHLFRQDPTIFYSIAKEVLPKSTKFSPTHLFIKLLQDKGKLLRNYTQNIDNLEVHAGVYPDKLVHCHGSFATATCVTCKTTYPGETIHEDIRNGIVPLCPKCLEAAATGRTNNRRKRKLPAGISDDEKEDSEEFDRSKGVLKPDITFFGEPLPSRFDHLLLGKGEEKKQDHEGDLSKCDLLICIGTSLEVAPVNQIIKYLNKDVPQIYISKKALKFIEFDLTIAGNCDDVVEWIADFMDWELIHEMNARKPLSKNSTTDDKDNFQKCSSLYKYPKGDIIFEKEDRVYRFQPLELVDN